MQSTNNLYDALFTLLTSSKIKYPYKLSVDKCGMPYISYSNYAGSLITSIIRTATAQPTLLHLLSGKNINIRNVHAVQELAVSIGEYFDKRLALLPKSQQRKMADILTHNMVMLCKSYDPHTRQAEVFCIHLITQCYLDCMEFTLAWA